MHTADASSEFLGETWFDFLSYQTQGDNGPALITNRSEGGPQINEEYCYESDCASGSSHDCAWASLSISA